MVSETSKLVEGLTEAHAWVLSDWIIVGGVVLLFLILIGIMFITLKKIFDRQLGILGRAVDDRARGLYLDHLPFINEKISGEIKRLEGVISSQTGTHDKDVLFLLQEIERLETVLNKGVVTPTDLHKLKLTKEEEAQRALQILLTRIRKDAL